MQVNGTAIARSRDHARESVTSPVPKYYYSPRSKKYVDLASWGVKQSSLTNLIENSINIYVTK